MNNKGTDQTAHMRRLVCAFVVRKTTEDRFSYVGPIFRVNPVYNSILCSFILNLRLLNHLDHRHHHLQPINRNKDFLLNLDTKQNIYNPKSEYAICFAPD